MSTDSKYKFSRSGILMIPFSFLYRNSLIWIVLLTAWAGGELHSTHIVGGDMSYRCLGNNQYEITLNLRRDCFSGGEDAPFDDPASIGFFDQYGTPLIHFGNHGQVFIPFTGDDTIQAEIPGICSILSSPVCVHEATYRTVVYLPPMEGDYILAYQRCCRNGTLNNIINPLQTGATYFVRIREEAQPVCNSGPAFNQWPDIYICTNNELVFDHSATDEDGDSLVYRLCTPSKGASVEEPRPQPPVKPPFGTVEWVEGFDLENLLGGDPLTIDPVTGIITATPDLQGQYLIGICVEEYRDGVLLSTTRRDFEYNVVLCLEAPSTDFTFSEGFCNGLTGTFTNLSTNADSYKWYFDFPNDDPAFTSTEISPSFTYPDTGNYTARLEATNSESGETCTSIVEKTVYVTDHSLTADFDHTLLQCEGDSLLVRFNDLSEDTFEKAEIISWQWESISDADTLFSMERNPVFKVPANQEFNIVLTVMSSTGCEKQKTEIMSISSIFPTAISIQLLDCLDSGFYFEFSDDSEYPDSVIAEEWIWNIFINGNVQMGGGSDLILQIPDSANITATLTTVLNNGCMGRAEDTFFVDRKTLVDFEIEFSECLAENLFRYHFTNTSHEFFHSDSTLFEWEILYNNETLRFEENEFDLELGLNQEIVVTLTAGYGANCQFSKSDTINTSDLIGGNPSFEYELLDCSDGTVSLEFSDNTGELFGGSELITRKWLIVTGSETFESMDSSFMLGFTPSGDISITLTHEYANGCTVSSVKDQGLNIPNINFIPDPVIVCEGVPAFIVENPDSSLNYEWSPLEGLTFSGENDFSNPQALPDQSTLYRVTVSEGDCRITDSVYVYRTEDIELEILGNMEICNGSLQLSVTGAGAHNLYEWSLDEEFNTILATAQEIDIPVPETTEKIFVRIHVNSCSAAIVSASIANNSVSLEFLDDPLYTCTGIGTYLVANPNSAWDYQWSPVEGLTFDPADDFSNPFAQPDTTTTYSVTVTNGVCSTTGMITVYRFEDIELDIVSSSEDCDEELALNVSGAPEGSVYEWSWTEDFSEILTSGQVVSITLTGEYNNIYVRAVLGDCFSDPLQISVQDQFVSLEFMEGPLFACTGSGTMLIANPNSAWTYEWSPLDGLTFDQEGDFSNPVALPDTTTTYSVTVTNGPCSEEGMVTVYRAEDIEITVQNTGDVCDSIMTLMVSGAPEGTDYEWSMTADFEDIFAIGNQIELTLMEGEVRIYVRALLGPCLPAVSFVDVADQSVAVDFFEKPLVSCSGSGTYLVSNPNSQWTYEWFPVEGLVFESEDDQSNPFAQPGETTTYYVTVTNGVCDETDSIQVVLSQDINLQLRGDISICDENILLTVSGAEGAEYIWSTSAIFADTLAIGDTLLTTQTEAEVTYFVKGIFENLCETRVEHITVTNQAVSVLLPTGPVIVCEGEGSKLVLNPNSNWTYTWDPTEGLIFDDPEDLSDPTALPDQTTIYSVTVTNGFCSDTASVEVARSEELTLQINGDTITCGESTVLSVENLESPAIYEWSRDEGFTEIIHRGAIFIVEPQQAKDTLYVRAMSGDCQIASTFIVLLDLTPPIELLGDLVVTCEAEPVSLVTNPDINYTYTWTPEDGLIFESGDDKSNPLALPDTTTEYIVTVVNGDCQAMDTITVIRIEDLTVVANQDSVDCDGNAYLSASTEASNVEYQWSADSTFTEILAVGSRVNITVSGSDSIYVRVATGACISSYTILPITFEPVLLDFFSDPLIVCRGIPSRMIANPNSGWTYEWNPMEGLDFPEGNHDPVVTLSESLTYFVTVSDGTCDLMDSIEVIATDTIPISITGDTSSCDGFTNLMAETMSTLPVIWSVNRNFDPVLVTSDTLNTAIEGKEQTFYARALMEGTSCESEVDSITVTNNAISLNEVGDLQICDNDTLDIAISSADTLQMIEVTWTENPHIISALDHPRIEVVRIIEEDTFVLHFMVSNQFLCELEDSLIIRTGTRQDSPAVTYEQICGEYRVCFTMDAESGTFLWDFGDESTKSDSSSFADICYTYPGTGEYEVTISSIQAACGFEAETTMVEVEEILTIDVTAVDTVYCEGDTVSISAETNGDPDNIIWSSTTNDSIGSGSELNYMSPGMDTVYAIITSESGCGDTAFVVLRQYLFDLVVEPYDPVCPGETMTITVTNNSGDNLTYNWSPEDCILTGSGTTMPVIWAIESKDLILNVTNPNNQCTDEIIIPVEVRDFNVNLEVSPDTMINLSESLEVTVITDTDGELTYQWSTGDTGESITDTPDETRTYTVVVTDEFGCSASDQVTVEVRQPLCNEFDVFLPTAFSPNNDGINDVLYVRSNFVSEMLLVVFDRWGNEVFRTTDINTGWNGRFRNNGHEMAPNAYAFSLKVVCINDLEYSTAGNVSLLR